MAGGANRPLEAFSATWTILAAFCVVFLVVHLYSVGTHKHISLRRWLCWLPIGMQMAVAMLVIGTAEVITRGSVWFWRATTGGDPARLVDFGFFLAGGATLGCVGFLCLLRVVTKPFGRWPVLVAILTMAGYLASFLFD